MRRTKGTAPGVSPNKGGRPPIVLGRRELAQMEKLAGLGLTEAAIAAVLGIGASTLREKKHAEEVSGALARGKARAESKVAEALYNRAIGGDVQAIKWWEMTRAGRTDKRETTGPDGAPLVPPRIEVVFRAPERGREDRGEDPRRMLGPPE